jgi:hypothetical protein
MPQFFRIDTPHGTFEILRALAAAIPFRVNHTRRSCQVNCLVRGPEAGSHSHQLGEGIRLHLLHHLPTMCLYRDLANAEFAADLLVQLAGHD